MNSNLRSDIARRLAQIRGSRNHSEFAAVLGVHKNTYGGYERAEREIGAEAVARLVQEGWSANWILTGKGPERLSDLRDGRHAGESPASYASQDLSGESLSIAVELTDEALRGLWLPKPRYYELVALIYDGLTQGLPYAEIIEFARPAASKLARTGGSDDGEHEVGGAGEGDHRGRKAGEG